MGYDSPFVCRFRLIQSLHVSEQGQSDLIEYVKSVYSLLWIATPSNLQFKRYIVTRYNTTYDYWPAWIETSCRTAREVRRTANGGAKAGATD